MTDLTVADFRSKFAEFSSVDDAVVSSLIPQAYGLSDVSEEATLYCIAHLVALKEEETGKPDGGSGEVMSDTIGPKTTAFMTQAETNREVFFSTTPYGRRVLAIESRTSESALAIVVA